MCPLCEPWREPSYYYLLDSTAVVLLLTLLYVPAEGEQARGGGQRVARPVRIGGMALHPGGGEVGGHRPAPADLDH